MSKKGGAKAPAPGALEGPDPAVLLQQSTSAWSITASTFGQSMNETNEVVRKLTEENALLKKQLAASEAKSASTYAHTTNLLEQQIKLTTAGEAKITELTNRLTRVPLEIKAAADAAKQIMQTEIDELTRKLRDREVALERLADFRKERDDLITELQNTRNDLEKEQIAHQQDIAALERRNIRDRDQVRAEMFETMREAKAKLLSQAAYALDGTTKRILAENEAIVGELAFQSAEAERVTKLNERLQEENINLKREVHMSADEIRELFRRTHTLTSALRSTKKELTETKALLEIANQTIQQYSLSNTISNNTSNEQHHNTHNRNSTTRPSTVPASPNISSNSILNLNPNTSVTKTINLSTATRSKNSSAPLLEKVRLPTGIKIAPVGEVTVTIPPLSTMAISRPVTTPNKTRPTTTPNIPSSNLVQDISQETNTSAGGTGETLDYFPVDNNTNNNPIFGSPIFSNTLSNHHQQNSEQIENLQSELMILKTELTTAKLDLDIALDALVVLDSQRLEMLSLADDIIASLLRVGNELRPILHTSQYDQVQNEAQAITARANTTIQSVDNPTRKMFYSLIQELLNDTLIISLQQMNLPNQSSSSLLLSSRVNSSVNSNTAIITALHNAERTVLARGTANGDMDAIPTDLSTGNAKLLCRLIFVLASRMRLYLSDIQRAIPEPLTVDELLNSQHTTQQNNDGSLLKPHHIPTKFHTTNPQLHSRIHQPLQNAVQRREQKNKIGNKQTYIITEKKESKEHESKEQDISKSNNQDNTLTRNAKYNAFIHG